jgi:hypothetical protein
MGRFIAELAPQVGNVDVEDVVVAEEVDAPDGVEQLLAGEDHARLANEGSQEVELEDGQLDRLASPGDGSTPRVDEEIAGPQRTPGVQGLGSSAPKESVDPGHELAR